jgi:hypothetical protein
MKYPLPPTHNQIEFAAETGESQSEFAAETGGESESESESESANGKTMYDPS